MGITKQQLKSIVKECLVEILSEGISTSINEVAKKKSTQQPTVSHSTKKPINQHNQHRDFSRALHDTIKFESGGNNVLAEILSDTARTTLPTMLENDKKRSGYISPTGQVEQAVAAHTPEQLFGEEAASKWAQLAFAEGPKK